MGLEWRQLRAVGWLVAAALAGWGAAGCTRVQGESCALDVDCQGGKVCRDATCRSPCMSSGWIGERVEVASGKVSRRAEIAGCEQRRYWVRYESGVEEQVDETRLVKRAGR